MQTKVMKLYLRLHAIFFGQLLVWMTKWMVVLVDVRFSGEEHIHESIRQGRPIIFVGWHGHNFLTMYAYYSLVRKVLKGTIMVPESKNGRVLDYFGGKMNMDVVKVKSDFGPSQWARATVSMIKFIRSGNCALLSPDGPSGPPYEVKPGIAVISQQSKAVVIPASAAASRAIRLRNRWDQHLIPLPFSRSVIHFDPPINTDPAYGPCPSAEELLVRIDAALTEGARKAEQLCHGSTTTKEEAS